MANANLEFPRAFEADDLKAGEEILLLLGQEDGLANSWACVNRVVVGGGIFALYEWLYIYYLKDN